MSRGFKIVRDSEILKHINNGSIRMPMLPKRATKMSAGYDFFSPVSFTLRPQETITIPLFIKAYMQPDEVLMIYPRSGHGFKYFIRLANSTGVIDSDYYGNEKNDGHIMLKIRNESQPNPADLNKVLFIEQGEAICQGVFTKYLLADNDSLETGDERVGGFGSTS